jgi:hypothetical protein
MSVPWAARCLGLAAAMAPIGSPERLSLSPPPTWGRVPVGPAAVSMRCVRPITCRSHGSSGCHVVDGRIEDPQRLSHVHVRFGRDHLGCGVDQARVGHHVAADTDAQCDLPISRQAAPPRPPNRLDDLAVRLCGGGVVRVPGEGPACQIDEVVRIVRDPHRNTHPPCEASQHSMDVYPVPRARKPTRPHGTNLALADVHVLDRALGAFYEAKDTGLLESYTTLVLRRVRHHLAETQACRSRDRRGSFA